MIDTKVVTVVFPLDLLKRIDERAKREYITRSALIRQLLHMATLEEEKKKGDGEN